MDEVIAFSAMFALLVSSAYAGLFQSDELIVPNDSSVANMSVEDATKVFVNEFKITHVFVDNQWRQAKAISMDYDGFTVTDETGRESVFYLASFQKYLGGIIKSS